MKTNKGDSRKYDAQFDQISFFCFVVMKAPPLGEGAWPSQQRFKSEDTYMLRNLVDGAAQVPTKIENRAIP